MNIKLALTNGVIYNQYEVLSNKCLLVDGEKIADIVDIADIPSDYTPIDVGGANICPGLIDLQIYGTGHHLFSAELTADSIAAIEQQLLAQGCTSFVLTLATNTIDVFKQAIKEFVKARPQVALGLHLEGPFLHKEKRGAHPSDLVIPASPEIIADLLALAQGAVKIMTVAPELLPDDCLALLKEANILVSAGHSMATYEQATVSFGKGVGLVTHLWNAMSSLHHREVGLPGAAFNHSSVSASIIVDGVHVDYEAVRLSKQLLGERLFLITDAVGACEKGIYQHILKDDHFVLPDGTLSGSALSLLKAVKNCVRSVGIPMDEALRMATLYPARIIQHQDLGNLNSGSVANVLVFDAEFAVIDVFFKGKSVLRGI